MTLNEIKSLVKDGATWAQVENHICQQIDIAAREAVQKERDASAENVKAKNAEIAAAQDALKAANEKAAADLSAAEAKHAEVEAIHVDQILAANAVTIAVQEEFASYRARAEQLISAAVANADNHDALKVIVAEAVKPELDRKRDEAKAKIAAAQAELDALG